MDSRARRELSKAIQREGTSLYEDPQRIKALLMDTCPESRTEIGLLVMAAEDGIPARLARSSDSVLRDGEIARAIADLRRTRRLDQGAAEWVVRSWAWAVGVLDREPADDLGDTTMVGLPIPARGQPGPLPQHQSTSPYSGDVSGPPYPPSAPPRHPSAPPGGYGPVPPNVPHPSAPPAGYPSAPPWPAAAPAGSQPWSSSGAPGSQGFAGSAGSPGGGWGPPPSQGWNPAAAPPPPKRNRGPLIAAIAAGAVVLLLALVGLVYVASGSSRVTAAPVTTPSPVAPAPPVATSAPAAPTTAEGSKEVDFTIVSNLTSFEVARTATVYSYGKRVGDLQINSANPTAELPVTSEPGETDYQLEIDMLLTPEQGGGELTFSGSGSITAYEGARYAVSIDKDPSGKWVATLAPVGGT